MTSGLGAIIVAAGASRRMGFDKLFAPLLGEPLIAHSIRAFQRCNDVDRIVLVCAESRVPEFQDLAARFPKVDSVVAGGRERVESVLAGLVSFPLGHDFIAVHDGARPLVTPEIISSCHRAAREYGAAVSAEPVTDTLHRTSEDSMALETVSRKNLWRMQTPQIIERKALENVLRSVCESGLDATDEISLLIRLGRRAKVVENPDWNLKVTYRRDLELAEMILQKRVL